jgi:MFS family permease
MLAIAAITLGLVRAPDWGWTSGATLGSLFGGVALLALFILRSARHRSPVLELDLLRVRSFAVSTLAMLLFSAGFAAMLLSIVVWAQAGWGWSALRTGLAFAPGPLMVPLFALGAGKVAGRVGAGAIAALGSVSFAAGALFWVVAVGRDAHYVSAMLPGALLTGIGVGLTLPTLTASAAQSLPAQRFATGSAVIHMSRQVGYTLGVAILVAVLGTPGTATERLDAYRRGWAVIAGLALLAAVAVLFLRRARPRVPRVQTGSAVTPVEASGAKVPA